MTTYNLTEEQYEELLNQYANEYFSDNNPDHVLYDMDSFDDLMCGANPSEIARMIFFGEFNPNHDYFYYNGYGNLESTDYQTQYFKDYIDQEYFLEWCDENGYLDDIKEDEEDEEDEE